MRNNKFSKLPHCLFLLTTTYRYIPENICWLLGGASRHLEMIFLVIGGLCSVWLCGPLSFVVAQLNHNSCHTNVSLTVATHCVSTCYIAILWFCYSFLLFHFNLTQTPLNIHRRRWGHSPSWPLHLGLVRMKDVEHFDCSCRREAIRT